MARHVAGLSQADLAVAAKVSAGFVAMIELGLRTPSPLRAGRLAEAMGVDVDTFLVDQQ